MYNKGMEDSIFTKIIKGEIPSHKVYEDNDVYAFLDIYPVATGHTLVVPKRATEFVWDMPDDEYMALMVATKKIALRLREVVGTAYVSSRIVGTDVPHAHVHLIPFNETKQLHNQQRTDIEPDHVTLATLAEKLRFDA